jgi:hypothetical protein
VATDKDQKGVPKLITATWPKAAPGLEISISSPMPVAVPSVKNSHGKKENMHLVPQYM